MFIKLYDGECRGKHVSLLALLETVAAAWLALRIAVDQSSFTPFAMSVAAAPLFLLRTRNSTAYGLRLARRFMYWADRKARVGSVVIIVPFLLIGPLLIRAWSTLLFLFREPGECIRAIPTNWWNLIAETDITTLPQVVPGYRDTQDTPRMPVFWDFRFYLLVMCLPFDRKPNSGRVGAFALALLSWVVMIPLAFLPSWLYRWTLKSTFWIYLPLLWIVRPVHLDRKHDWLRVQRIANDLIGVGFSSLVLALGLVKIRIWQARTEFTELLDASMLGRFFSEYIAPNSMPAWQYASIINALLALVMYWLARAALNAREEGSPWPEHTLDIGFRITMVIRRLLALYTMLVLIMITLRQGFPPIGEVLPP